MSSFELFARPVVPPAAQLAPDRHWPAGAAAQTTALAALGRLLDRREAVWDDDDPEAVHRLRVASRHLRALLETMAPVLDDEGLAGGRREVGRLARVLGEARDLDVAIAHWRRALEDDPTGGPRAAARRRLLRRFGRRRRRMRAALRDALTRFAERRVPETLAETLGRRPVDLTRWRPDGGPPPRASPDEPTFGAVVAGRVEDLVASLWEAARHLEDPARVAELHTMRLAAKRARYVIAAFESALVRSPRRAVRRLQRLQDELGAIHDADVRADTLRREVAAALRRLRRDVRSLPLPAGAADPRLGQAARELGARLAGGEALGLLQLLEDEVAERSERHAAVAARWDRLGRKDFRAELLSLVAADASERRSGSKERS